MRQRFCVSRCCCGGDLCFLTEQGVKIVVPEQPLPIDLSSEVSANVTPVMSPNPDGFGTVLNYGINRRLDSLLVTELGIGKITTGFVNRDGSFPFNVMQIPCSCAPVDLTHAESFHNRFVEGDIGTITSSEFDSSDQDLAGGAFRYFSMPDNGCGGTFEINGEVRTEGVMAGGSDGLGFGVRLWDFHGTYASDSRLVQAAVRSLAGFFRSDHSFVTVTAGRNSDSWSQPQDNSLHFASEAEASLFFNQVITYDPANDNYSYVASWTVTASVKIFRREGILNPNLVLVETLSVSDTETESKTFNNAGVFSRVGIRPSTAYFAHDSNSESTGELTATVVVDETCPKINQCGLDPIFPPTPTDD